MRLIDADKLHYKRVLLNDCTQSAVVVFAKEIDKAERIEAIPIEWLKHWEEKHKDDPCYCKFVSEEILEDWEKENETD